MRIEAVEILSDASNAAVLRHPGRRFPGVLVQGDTLHSMCQAADRACAGASGVLGAEEYEELDELRSQLRAFLSHYRQVLSQHNLPLPFSEPPHA